MGKQGGGGGAAPSMGTAAPNAGGSSAPSRPGLDGNAGSQAQAQGQARAVQQPQAGPDHGLGGKANPQAAQQSAQAAQDGKTLQSSGPAAAPQWKDSNPGTPAQETAKAGQTLNNAGVTTDAKQSPDQQAQMKAALDNASKNGQTGREEGNGSKIDAARSEAKSSPAQEAPSQSPSMQR